ncbi:MFS transporter [Aeromicrobium sp.]|uniref:MFS transporter n=1 Tax=Aeromicrobium sp. TaxID=1871063 RepID=UPI0025BD2DDA|nr:MFS transporter [Aeromicrobium sp.]
MTTMPPDDTMAEADPPTTSTATHKNLGIALVVICMAQLMVVLDATIANIALPYIGTDLGIGQNNLQWVVTGYALAFGGLLLLGGRLGDQFGRRRVFMIGLVLFVVASSLGGLAQNEAMLLSSRALQGLGAALASPAALALITTTFPAGPQRNRAFSIFAALAGIGAAFGLVLGGWLTGIESDTIQGWRLTFLINVPIGLVAAFLAPRYLDESKPRRVALDVPGAAIGTVGIVSLVYGFSRAGEAAHGWDDPFTILALAAGAALLVAFVLVERSVRNPLMPLSLFADRARSIAFATMFITPAAMFAMFFFMSLVLQNVSGWSPLHTGLAFLPFTVGMIGGATLASNLIVRLDPRYLVGTGTLISGFSLLMFSRIAVDDSPANIVAVATGNASFASDIDFWIKIAPFIVTMAFGMGLNFVTMTLVAVHGIPAEDSGIGSGVLNTMQQVGGAVGLAALSTAAVHFTRDKAESIGAALQSMGGTPPPASAQKAIEEVVGQAAFTAGAAQAFLIGAFMIFSASALVWVFMNTKHADLHADELEGVAIH